MSVFMWQPCDRLATCMVNSASHSVWVGTAKNNKVKTMSWCYCAVYILRAKLTKKGDWLLSPSLVDKFVFLSFFLSRLTSSRQIQNSRKQHGGQWQCNCGYFSISLLSVLLSNSTPTERCSFVAWGDWSKTIHTLTSLTSTHHHTAKEATIVSESLVSAML